MNIKKIQDVDVQGKKIIVRTDFNVSVDEDGDVKSQYKIAAAKETIDHLVHGGASHIALLTHFGRPEDVEDKMVYSLGQLRDDAERILGREVTFVPNCIGTDVQEAVDQYAEGKILLLENVRFHDGEKSDQRSFASQLCLPFDLYVNDAFAVCHREHASVHAITQCIPSYAGLWLQKELTHLKKVKKTPEHPAVAIIGGAKIDTKIPMITEFSRDYDVVLVGGRTAVEARERNLELDNKVILPTDFEYKFYDIGPKTIERFSSEIKKAKTIVWNGPMGLIEQEKYKRGTYELINAIAQNEDCFSLIGGGESVQLVEESGMMQKISFVSTGGGAMLAYLGGEAMPGVDVLLR